MVTESERAVKMQNPAVRFFCNFFVVEFFFFLNRQNQKFKKKSILKKIGQPDYAFLLLLLNPEAFENQKTGCGAMTKNIRVLFLMSSETGKWSRYSVVLHI